MPTAPKSPEAQEKFDHNADRAPTFAQALRRILDRGDHGEKIVERLEVQCLQSGEVTYRLWQRNAEEPEGGVLS